jgi:hypothetical protein
MDSDVENARCFAPLSAGHHGESQDRLLTCMHLLRMVGMFRFCHSRPFVLGTRFERTSWLSVPVLTGTRSRGHGEDDVHRRWEQLVLLLISWSQDHHRNFP